jgi:hypothetical protein
MGFWWRPLRTGVAGRANGVGVQTVDLVNPVDPVNCASLFLPKSRPIEQRIAVYDDTNDRNGTPRR